MSSLLGAINSSKGLSLWRDLTLFSVSSSRHSHWKVSHLRGCRSRREPRRFPLASCRCAHLQRKKGQMEHVALRSQTLNWLRASDLNWRPSGCEPDQILARLFASQRLTYILIYLLHGCSLVVCSQSVLDFFPVCGLHP